MHKNQQNNVDFLSKKRLEVGMTAVICEECGKSDDWELSIWCGNLEVSCGYCGLCYDLDGNVQIDTGA
jgi:hypothetical protein